MSEVRKPVYSLLLKSRNAEENKKIEVFMAEEFPLGEYLNSMTGKKVQSHKNLYRVRVDGRWFPSGVKYLHPKIKLSNLITEILWRMG